MREESSNAFSAESHRKSSEYRVDLMEEKENK